MPRILITAGVDSVGSFRTVMRRSSVRPGRLKWLIPRLKWIQVSVISLFWLTGCQPQAPDPDYSPPHSPQAALDTFDLAPGFEIEVFAAEPLIRDPVAMEIDEDGRIYVVETGGYPLNTEPIGRVRLLLDQDGDGLPDESFVFADGLVLPTGVMRWKNGILVTAAPDLLYLEDSDGDGQADVRETVLTGFAFSNPQHTVNLPVYGLDNWIYLANEGGFGAVIFQEKFGDRGGRNPLPGPGRLTRSGGESLFGQAATRQRWTRKSLGPLPVRTLFRRVGTLLYSQQRRSRPPRSHRCSLPSAQP